jgi:large subunit ribosomal protein L10
MSKYLKNLMADHLKSRLDGVSDLLVVDVMGMESQRTVALRKTLRQKKINLLVVKNSLARRATEGTALAPAFEGVDGSAAVVWGGEDIVSLAKEITKLTQDKAFEPFVAKGGVMDGSKLSAAQVQQVSKWPSRAEQLSILVGQILSPGATLSAQLLSPGAKLASQVKKKSEGEEEAS